MVGDSEKMESKHVRRGCVSASAAGPAADGRRPPASPTCGTVSIIVEDWFY